MERMKFKCIWLEGNMIKEAEFNSLDELVKWIQ